MSSCHGFIKYTVEVFTQDEDFNESRGEREIIIVAPISEKIDVSTTFPSVFLLSDCLTDSTDLISCRWRLSIMSGFINY